MNPRTFYFRRKMKGVLDHTKCVGELLRGSCLPPDSGSPSLVVSQGIIFLVVSVLAGEAELQCQSFTAAGLR